MANQQARDTVRSFWRGPDLEGGDYWQPLRELWTQLSDTIIELRGGRPRRSELATKRWLNPFPAPDTGIVFTGARGTGKTMLHKALRQRLPVGKYIPREESPDKETDRFVAMTRNGKKRVQLVVVPGQKDSTTGMRTINRYFRDGRSPTGVVHVSSWGYSTIWDSGSERAALELMRAAGTGGREPVIDRIRAYNLEHELDDFRQTRDLLQEAWRYTTKPIWLILAISKVDLYRDHTSLAEVGRHYIPAANPNDDREFARELRGLVDYLGQGRLRGRITILPVCSYLERYTMEGAIVQSRGDLDLTSVLMTNFSNKIGEFCGDEQEFRHVEPARR
jgi:hypothetical protein